MKLIDGKAIAAQIKAEVRARAEKFFERHGKQPGLAVVLFGDDPASQIYVRNKIRACEETGVRSFTDYLPADVTERQAEEVVRALAEDEKVHGVLIQLPLPAHLDGKRLLSLIPPIKDVDGFSAENVGRLALGEAGTVACTPLGVMELLRRSNVSPEGKRAVVVGRSNIVGKPMAMLLLNANATVTVCHSRTADLKEECARADILIAAVGRPAFITADMVKEGAVVIDVGVNRTERGVCGDVDFGAVCEKASLITPVPGGVGPMTVAMLLQNTVAAAEAQEG